MLVVVEVSDASVRSSTADNVITTLSMWPTLDTSTGHVSFALFKLQYDDLPHTEKSSLEMVAGETLLLLWVACACIRNCKGRSVGGSVAGICSIASANEVVAGECPMSKQQLCSKQQATAK